MADLCSNDNQNFYHVAQGSFVDDATQKITTITPTQGQYVKIEAVTEAGGRGDFTTAAEINVFPATQDAPPAPQGHGAWVLTVNFPLVPVSMANEYASGNILAWSSYSPSSFGGSDGGSTITATYAPGTQTVTSALITNTQHDMFCVGLSLDFDGKNIATGGNTAPATSIFDSAANAWTKGPVSHV